MTSTPEKMIGNAILILNSITEDNKFSILEGFIKDLLNDAQVNAIKALVESQGTSIGSTLELGSIKRKVYTPDTGKLELINEITLRLTKLFTGKHIHMSPCSIIHSPDGTRKQQLHTDFDTHMSLTKQSYFIIVDIEGKSKLNVVKDNVDKTLNLNEGDVLICRGDTIHAGSAYNYKNTRLHYYVDYHHNKRKHNTVYVYNQEVVVEEISIPPANIEDIRRTHAEAKVLINII